MIPPGDRSCIQCRGEGFVTLAGGVVDACGRCARAAEAEWQARHATRERSEGVLREEGAMSWMEQTGPGGAGMVTAAAELVDGVKVFDLLVHPPLLRELPCFRGGQGVSVVRGLEAESGKLRITRGGPYRLMDQVHARLAKLHPVRLRVVGLEWLRPERRAAEAVAFKVLPGMLEISLPEWARPPVPLTAPPTSYAAVGGRS